MRRLLLAAVAPAAAALIVAGCGGGYGSNQGKANTAPTSSGASAAARLTVDLTKLSPGKALVDSKGKALYLFEADKGDRSTCGGACASLWPPATTSGKPVAGPGVNAAKLSTTKRSDGKLEVTYNGHPLYYYAADARPGETNGQGLNQFGAKWYVLNAGGSKIDSD